MSEAADIPPDALAGLASIDVQRQAARQVQEAFARVFRISLGETTGAADGAELATMLGNWCAAGGSEDGRALRRALIVAGLDQWGLAYSRAFGLVAIPALSALLGELRTALGVREDARFQRYFAAIDEAEGNGIDFKIVLRRDIHLALWHAMIASEDRDDALRILETLGSLLLSLTAAMPQLGWRLIADTVAHIQIRCLAGGLASDGLAGELNGELFASLQHALSEWRTIAAHAGNVVLAWQQAQRTH